jgi:uncharacterized LabA/DUF88 family protein
MSKKPKVSRCIYIDLSNIYGGICELFEPGVYIDFATLMPILDKAFGGINQFKVYGAYMGEKQTVKHGADKVRAQNEFISSALSPGVYFGKGHISRDQKEKGVDMRLGVDIVNDARLGLYTDFILFSGDADFQYPVDIIKKMKNKYFHYCGFANRYHSYFTWQARKKVVIDYNKIFAKGINKSNKPPKDLKIIDIYNNKAVKIKSV